MGELMHMSKQGARIQRFIVYRCDRCGFLSYGAPEIEPGEDNGPPGLDVDCGCYMGPRWVRGVWTRLPLARTTENPES